MFQDDKRPLSVLFRRLTHASSVISQMFCFQPLNSDPWTVWNEKPEDWLTHNKTWAFKVMKSRSVFTFTSLFLKSRVNADRHQDISEHFMFPSADKLHGEADFIFQDSAPAHSAKDNQKLLKWPWCYCVWWARKLSDVNPVVFMCSL